nr:hypothetical protein [uncultured Lachnoclostridium sp.]
MYYVYRYLDRNNRLIYIGITNDLIARKREHKQNSSWYSDDLRYQFVQVKNKYIAKAYEEYIINRDNPEENKALRNGYDVSEIEFNLEHDWTDFREIEAEERNRLKVKKPSAKYLETQRKIRQERLLAYEMFFLYRDKIIEINWCNGQISNVVFDSSEVKKIAAECRWMPGFISGFTYNEDDDVIDVILNTSGIQYRDIDDQKAFNQICGMLVEVIQSSYLGRDSKTSRSNYRDSLYLKRNKL